MFAIVPGIIFLTLYTLLYFINCIYIIIYCCGQIPPKLAAIYYLPASGDQESRYGLCLPWPQGLS